MKEEGHSIRMPYPIGVIMQTGVNGSAGRSEYHDQSSVRPSFPIRERTKNESDRKGEECSRRKEKKTTKQKKKRTLCSVNAGSS
jgi:hypothetical protein